MIMKKCRWCRVREREPQPAKRRFYSYFTWTICDSCAELPIFKKATEVTTKGSGRVYND